MIQALLADSVSQTAIAMNRFFELYLRTKGLFSYDICSSSERAAYANDMKLT